MPGPSRTMRGALALAGSVALAAPAGAAVWVSPRGQDRADGSREHPFRTLSRARDAVRAELARGVSHPEVRLLDGTFRLARPLVLDARDSGSRRGDVVWRAAAGARPVISGAVRVRGWRLHDRRRGIFVARVRRGLAGRQLYVGGRRATRARSTTYPPGFSRTAAGFRISPPAVAPRPGPTHLEAVTRTQWKMMRCPVAAVRPGELVMAEPCWTNVNVFPALWSFQTLTWLENSYELLDAPGEWYLDSARGRLYAIPRRGQRLAGADVELPVTQALVDVRGTLSRPVSDLRFEGLTFAYGTWLGPSGPGGYAADQSGFHLEGRDHPPNLTGHDPNTERTPGNIRLRHAHRVTFSHDDFRHLGAVALDFGTGSQRDRIVANRFDDVSSAAIQLGGVDVVDHHPRHAGQTTRDNLIAGNRISRSGREYQDAAAIFAGFTTRSTIEHNDISDVPWAGIAIGWGWGLLDPGGFPGVPHATPGEWGRYRRPTTSRGNRIVANRIRRFLQVLWDGGAIYSLGRQGRSPADGEVIAGNVASGKRERAGGNVFYTDGGSRYVTLTGNVSLDNPPGVTDFGPCGLRDSLSLCGVHEAYGSDRGGCRPYGQILYHGNYFEHPAPFFSVCPFPPHPLDVVDDGNHLVIGPADVPAAVLGRAGPTPRRRSAVGAP